ncbi:helix-turn-helix domain-containing protein [Klebsiella michiganensis]|uniref:helix-turn-helix domain-containing protein n=1 Tax=Klebsiella michiganensis TaxID=1134687 RepID=UPI002570B8BE|nr:helix-turn-helix domain-containing protein [Klebsiella michiganensis]MDL4455019.1 helix-turn-helix domain-containing protein [Klebsiella michiganensis]
MHLITEGCFTLTRRHDGLLVAVDSAPFIFGLTELFHYPSGYDLIAERPCRGSSLSAACLRAKLARTNLWQDVAQILAYFVHQLTLRDNQLIAANAYTMVRHKLLELMSLPEAVRQKTNVQQFIHQRTRLSRSGIMKILADLRTGEYITIQQGRLIDIRTLPTDY